MNRIVKTVSIIAFSLLLSVSLFAQDRFDRVAQIPAVLPDDVGGFGNIVTNVDLDEDGKLEIYAINTDWFDLDGLDLVPRLYKYEQDDNGQWVTVWMTELNLTHQNTWAALATADLDNDGKGEIVWGPVNNFGGVNQNPERIVVYEVAGDGSDVMGVAAGTYYRPNAQWTITDQDADNVRPFRWLINDIDGDNVDEIVAGCRAGDGIQVYSVDDVPDAADSTETWKLEFSGVAETFYDIAILNGRIVGLDNDGDVFLVDAVEADSFVVADTALAVNGGGSWNSAVTADVDGDETSEIIVASWSTSLNNVYVLQEDADTLKGTIIADLPSSSGRLYGGTAGDVDGDGQFDFVFGTRGSDPNGIIHRLEYQGGPIDDPNSWTLSIMDDGVNEGIQYDIFGMADFDDDGEDEVVYTGTARGVTLGSPPAPVTILDRVAENQPIIKQVVDVPNDQGRQVWVIWKASADDVVPNGKQKINVGVIAPKGVTFPLQKINGMHVQAVPVNQEASLAAAGDIVDYGVWRLDADGLPVQLQTTKAAQFAMYAAVVPTLGDSSDTDYVVSAHTADPAVNWKSLAKTGFSVDNLIPTAPGKVAAKESEGNIALTWEEVPDEDFDYFSIRRGTSAGFNAADPSTEVGTTTDIAYLDADISEDQTYFYRIVAFDFNGNQGNLSEEVSAIVSDVEGLTSPIPTEFALKANYPNPFNPTTTIAFDLPENVDVSIVIYNTLGHKVRTLVNEAKVAGSYSVVWDGLNDSGARVATGIYIYNIRAGKFMESRKMTLIK